MSKVYGEFGAKITGIHIRSRTVVSDDYNLSRTTEITSKVVLWTSEVLLKHKIYFKKFLYDFTCVPITTHPLKTFRITEYNTQLLYGMKSYVCAPSLMVQYFPRKDRRPNFYVVNRWHFSFCEELLSWPIAGKVTAFIKMWRFLKAFCRRRRNK